MHSNSKMIKYIYELKSNNILTKQQFLYLLENQNAKVSQYLYSQADKIRRQHYGIDVYIRGLIEFSSYCKNDCYYCGLKCSNKSAQRYRLTEPQILQCCDIGYALGFRTFVLQSGEDPYYTDDIMVSIISKIKQKYPDCAITLSLGEKSKQSYKLYRQAGADRYLLRFETSDPNHYAKLHPQNLTLESRLQCIYHLHDLGYTVGTGFMVGSPYQTYDNLADDLLLLDKINPEMVGIGPFVPHHSTKFASFDNGSLEDTLFVLGLIRLMLPTVLLPCTTALATIHPKGRELGLKAGCNVIMPNLSPLDVRKQYSIYDNKAHVDEEAAENKRSLENLVNKAGYKIVTDRGDPLIINKM